MVFDWIDDLLAFAGRRKKTMIKDLPQLEPLPAGVKFPEFCMLCGAVPERFERLCMQVFEYLVNTNEVSGRVASMAENLIEYCTINPGARAEVTCVSAWPDLVFVASVTADDIGVQKCKITVGSN